MSVLKINIAEARKSTVFLNNVEGFLLFRNLLPSFSIRVLSPCMTNVKLVTVYCKQVANFCPASEHHAFSIYECEGNNDCKISCHTSRNRRPAKKSMLTGLL